MYSRITQYTANKSFFLFGPRGTGKSSWIKATFPEDLYIDLLEAEIYNDLLASPQRLERMVPAGHEGWILIDEVQKVPALLDEVHRLIENRGWKFVLTGSSARKLKREEVNLLAGRALTKRMFPLTRLELGADFSLDHSLEFGLLPSVYTEADPKSFLESYVRTYLQEEVQQEGLTRNLSSFSRFLEAASFSQGMALNITEIARECALNRKLVSSYFEILEDILLAVRVPVFTRRARRRMSKQPKFYFFDAGVFRTLRPKGPLDSPEEIDGAVLETLCFQELIAVNEYLGLGYDLYYWRTSNQVEVDFVLYGERGIKAFEIKRTRRPRSKDFSGLKAFRRDYPEAEAYLVYGGDRWLDEHGVHVVPVETFLEKIPQIL